MANKPLRVALVRSGSLMQQHHLTALCGFLAERGIQLDFISLQASESEVQWFGAQIPNIVVHSVGEWLGKGFGRFIKGGWALRKQLRLLQFDILYVVDSWTLRYVAVATLGTMRWAGRPTVYHTFDMLVPHVAARVDILLERHTARRSHLNINTDRSRAAVVKALFGLKETPLSVPLRLPYHAALPQPDESLRALLLESAVTQNDFLIVNPTNLSSERLGKELIQAFTRLPSQYHLVTIDGVGLYSQTCRDLVECHKMQARIHILAPMSHDDLLKICACADVGLIFYDAEASLGNYLCHPSRLAYFVALGLPVVATDMPMIEALIYRYGLGICCPPTEPERIAAAIQAVCVGGEPLSERKKRIRQAFESELHYECSAPLIVEALQRIRPTVP